MGINILIIESGSMIKDLMTGYNKNSNWNIYNSKQQKGIKKHLKKNNIDIVLLSLTDLKKEGIMLLKMIKRYNSDIQIITINSGKQISLSIDGMKLGVFEDYIMPLDLDSLFLRISDAYKVKKDLETNKPTIFESCQNIMMAVSFAEAGMPDIAIELLAKSQKRKETKKHNSYINRVKGDNYERNESIIS